MRATPSNKKSSRAARAAGPRVDWRALVESASVDDYTLAMLIRSAGAERSEDELDALLRTLVETPPPDGAKLSLDAAIDLRLAAGVRRGSPIEAAAAELIRSHGALRTEIDEAVALSGMVDAGLAAAGMGAPAASRKLPQDFGLPLDTGQRRYRLEAHLGSGAFADVYLATDRHLSDADAPARVAIKILRAGDAMGRLRGRLFDEATKLRRLDHPNVLRVFDFGLTADREAYLVLEHVDGGDLGGYMASRAAPLSAERAAALAADIARGVEAAHRSGLVHCDLKPANVLLAADGAPKVADFGIAVRRREGRPRAGSVENVGNLAFMAPEQLESRGAPSPASDIYAIGGLLYWLLTLDLPSGDSRAEVESSLRGSIESGAAPARVRAAPIDQALRAVCGRALAPDPARRHPTAGALADDLERWLRHEPIEWTRPGPLRRARLFARRRPFVASSMALLALLTGSIIAGLITMRRLASVEHEHELLAARAEAFREADARWRAQTFSDVDLLLKGLISARAVRQPAESLLALWVLEWVQGPTVLGAPDVLPEIWSTRSAIVRAVIDELRAGAGRDSVEALLWETSLGFWLVRAGRHEEAAQIAAANAEAWERLAGSDDSWSVMTGAIRDAARLHMLLEAPGLSADAGAVSLMDRLFVAAQRLDAAGGSGRAVRTLALDALRRAAADERFRSGLSASQMAAIELEESDGGAAGSP